MKNLYSFIILLCSTALLSQTTIVLQPDAAAGKDARIFSLDGLANYGSDPDFIATIANYVGEPGTTRSLIQFDLSSLPQGTEIIDARISLYYNHESQTPGQAGNNASYLRRLIVPWDENTVAWAMQPVYTLDNQILIPESVNGMQDYENIDVTALVRDMVEFPSNSFGFMFMLQTEQGISSMKFYSSDGAIAEKRPLLQVTYGTVANKEIHFENAVIQPNPFSNAFVIRDLQGKYSVSISDMNGRTIYKVEAESTGNDLLINHLDDVPAGMYFINAIGKSDNYFGKIVKTSE